MRTTSLAAHAPQHDGDVIAHYFEWFLPRHLHESSAGGVRNASAIVRFIIGDEPHDQWTCRFEEGKIVEVHRGPAGPREEFGFSITRLGFLRVIAGKVAPQAMFFDQNADVFGDLLKALQMVAVLESFIREFPCNPAALASR